MGKLSPPVIAPWKGALNLSYQPIEDVAPPASLALLREINDFVHWGCTAPYPVPAVWADLAVQWHFAIRTNIGADALRVYVTRAVGTGTKGTPNASEITTSSSGNRIDVDAEIDGTDVYPPAGLIKIIQTSDTRASGAAAGVDRSGELGDFDYSTAAVSTANPYNEGISLKYGAGFGAMIKVLDSL